MRQWENVNGAAALQARNGRAQPWGEAEGSTGVTAPPCGSLLTLVQEDVTCIKGDTGKDIISGTRVALIHCLDLHVQPAGKAKHPELH